jgi:spoIIIJ-associated protein
MATPITPQQRLEELVSFFGINAQVHIEDTDEGMVLDVAAAEGTARLIGYHGDTLRSLEYLLNQIVRQDGTAEGRIMVDVGGYQRARRGSLEETAREVAARVASSGQEEELPPLNPAERRLVHMALRDQTDVMTESRGEGKGRRIVIKRVDTPVS